MRVVTHGGIEMRGIGVPAERLLLATVLSRCGSPSDTHCRLRESEIDGAPLFCGHVALRKALGEVLGCQLGGTTRPNLQ